MYKLTIHDCGKDIDFLMPDFPEDLREQKVYNISKIITGKVYPLVILPNANIPKTIIDIGANIGAASLFFSRNYPESEIFSFEPTETTFHLLRQNMINFNTKNVTIFQKGVFKENTRLKIHINSRTPGVNSIFKNSRHDNYEHADFINLNDFFEENKIKNIDILKIDTEGSELDILGSLKNWTKKISVIYLEYHSGSQRNQVQNLLTNTHNLLLHRLSGYDAIPLDDCSIGRINFKDIVHHGNPIISRKQMINKEHLFKLREIGYSFIEVVSKDLGEMCFLNKEYKQKRQSLKWIN